MQKGFLILAAVLVCAAVSAAQAAEDRRVTTAEYAAELESWSAYLGSVAEGRPVALPPPAPDRWVVHDGDGPELRVDSGFLAGARICAQEPGHPECGRARARLNLLRSAALARTAIPTNADARAKAGQVLRRWEFRGVRTPGMRESFRDRVLQAVSDFLQRLLGSSPNLRGVASIFLWGLIGLALVVLALWVTRLLRSGGRELPPLTGSPEEVVSARSWQVWLAEARAAAARGDFREAVRHAYWAAISSLETRGAWKPDRARTPREYLRLLEESSPDRRPLVELTSDFERIWYARQAAGATDFASSLSRLQQLGCQ